MKFRIPLSRKRSEPELSGNAPEWNGIELPSHHLHLVSKLFMAIHYHCEYECPLEECNEECTLRSIAGRRIGLREITENNPENNQS